MAIDIIGRRVRFDDTMGGRFEGELLAVISANEAHVQPDAIEGILPPVEAAPCALLTWVEDGEP